MSAVDSWDRRYEASTLVWSAEPNQTVAEHCGDLPPGRALDVAAGEGRNSIWLASRGWSVTAVDFSRVALDKGRRLADAQGDEVAGRIEWVTADLLTIEPEPATYDLAVIAYLHLPASQRKIVLRATAAAITAGGTFVLIAHDSTNLQNGTGGPQDPDVLYSPEDVTDDLSDSGLDVLRSERTHRHVDGHPDAIDALVIARRPHNDP